MPARLPRSTSALAAVAGLVASGLAAVAFAPAAHADPAQPTPDCSAAVTCTVTFGYVGSWQTFTVPDDVTSVTTIVRGAQGGNQSQSTGGVTSATVAVEPGSSLEVAAGQQGAYSPGTTFGGGGATGDPSYYASGGGGSFVSHGSTLLLVAGGGGGSGIWIGGAGGGAVGGVGESVASFGGYYGTPATAGTQSSAGQGGTSGSPYDGDYGSGTNGSGAATATSFGPGGNGGFSPQFGSGYSGGGGGGGFYGGGGGSVGNGGAGGSGYVASDSAVTGGTTSVGGNSGNGSVTFTWAKASTSTTLTASPTSGAATTDDSVSLTATVTSDSGTPTGTVAFKDGATTITGCAGTAVDAAGVATCTTSFAAGDHSLSATYAGTAAHAGSTDAIAYGVASLPSIATTQLPDATYGTAYSQTLTATGGTAPYTFALAEDTSLPAGLDTAADGTISGTPQTAPASPTSFAVQVTDAANRSTTKQLELTVTKAAQAIAFTFAPTDPTKGGTYVITDTNVGPGSAPLEFAGNVNCSISGATVTFIHAGLCTVTGTQAGDGNYADAESVDHSVTVGKEAQALLATSTPPSSGIVGGSHALVVTGGKSSSPVSVGIGGGTTNSACSLGTTTTAVVGDVQQATTTISYDRIGTCSIDVQQAGDNDYSSAPTSFVTTQVGGKATTTALTLSSADVVHGQPVTATATVTGASAGTVKFYVDGDLHDSQPLGSNGATTSSDLAATPGLPVGGHAVTAQFVPSDANAYATSPLTAGSPLTVSPAKTSTALKINAKSLVATVSVKAPSMDLPTGSVTFTVAGKNVGVAQLVDGVATLTYQVPAGSSVSAVYSGRDDSDANTEVGSSSVSTARKNPTVTAKVTSGKGKSRAGWYSRPVTVRFTCKAGSDALTGTCPAPVAITRNGVTTINRTVHAKDGGVATVHVTVKVDRARPTVKITGITAGRAYPGALPTARCAATDKQSGIASCHLVRRTKGITVTYTATATDRAGNTSRKTVSIKRSPVLIAGADYRGTRPVVKRGKSYTLVVTGKARPSYVYAAPTPIKPKGNGGSFTKVGKNRWAYSVVFTKNLRGHTYWNFGIKIGKKTVTVTVKVVK